MRRFVILSLALRAASLSMAAAPRSVRASCFCGDAVVVVAEPEKHESCSICHCSVCRRLSGAPFICSVILPLTAVTIEHTRDDAAAVAETRSSKFVVRRRCGGCGSPLMSTLKAGGGKAVVPLALFDRTTAAVCGWRPQHHLHYDSRVIDANDDLPKFANRCGGPTVDAA